MVFEDVALSMTPEDVERGVFYRVLDIKNVTTQYGIRWVATIRSKGAKFELWLMESQIREVKRYLIKNDLADYDTLCLSLGTEKYVAKKGKNEGKEMERITIVEMKHEGL